ncbi:MAG: hypothetical protein V2A64_04335, partial [Candidatus Omnitrophota bacterium]
MVQRKNILIFIILFSISMVWFANYTFANSQAVFTGSFTVTPLDSNNDGKYDVLQVIAEVEINSPYNYSVIGLLKANGEFITDRESFVSTMPHGYNIPDSQTGKQNAVLRFSGEDIYQKGIDGEYELDIGIMKNGSGVIVDHKVFNIGKLNHNDFRERGADIQKISEYVQDTNNNGLYEYIIVSVKVNVVTPGKYSIEAVLWNDNYRLNEPVVHDTINREIDSSSTQVFELKFNGQEINNSKVNGPHRIQIILINENGE